jgi:hypothetical protein
MDVVYAGPPVDLLALGGVICSALEIIGGLGLSSRLIVSFST